MVGPVGGHTEVVGHKQDGGAVLLAQPIDEIENALLHRHVEGAGWLVGDDQRRPHGDCDRDQDTLPHAPRSSWGYCRARSSGCEGRRGRADR